MKAKQEKIRKKTSSNAKVANAAKFSPAHTQARSAQKSFHYRTLNLIVHTELKFNQMIESTTNLTVLMFTFP